MQLTTKSRDISRPHQNRNGSEPRAANLSRMEGKITIATHNNKRMIRLPGVPNADTLSCRDLTEEVYHRDKRQTEVLDISGVGHRFALASRLSEAEAILGRQG